MNEAKEVMAHMIQEPNEFAETIDRLSRSALLQMSDRNPLFAIQSNIELGMAPEQVYKRVLEVASATPQLITLLVAFSVYKFYNKN